MSSWNLDEALLYLPQRPDCVSENEYSRRWKICNKCHERELDHCTAECNSECSLQFRMKHVYWACPKGYW